MTTTDKIQCCALCAWRENCARKFSAPDGGARCVDFSRDVSIKDPKPADNSDRSEGKS